MGTPEIVYIGKGLIVGSENLIYEVRIKNFKTKRKSTRHDVKNVNVQCASK